MLPQHVGRAPLSNLAEIAACVIWKRVTFAVLNHVVRIALLRDPVAGRMPIVQSCAAQSESGPCAHNMISNGTAETLVMHPSSASSAKHSGSSFENENMIPCAHPLDRVLVYLNKSHNQQQHSLIVHRIT